MTVPIRSGGDPKAVPRGDEVRAKTVYDSPGIVVTGASAEYLLAMKVFAAREPDLQDIKHLAGMLGIDEASDAIRICERAYPGWVVMEKTRRESTRSPTRERNGASRCPS